MSINLSIGFCLVTEIEQLSKFMSDFKYLFVNLNLSRVLDVPISIKPRFFYRSCTAR